MTASIATVLQIMFASPYIIFDFANIILTCFQNAKMSLNENSLKPFNTETCKIYRMEHILISRKLLTGSQSL